MIIIKLPAIALYCPVIIQPVIGPQTKNDEASSPQIGYGMNIKWFFNDEQIEQKFGTVLAKQKWDDIKNKNDATKGDVVVVSTDSTQIWIPRAANERHSGQYRCVARNDAGEASKRFGVAVLVRPNIDENSYKPRIVIKEGEHLELKCPVRVHNSIMNVRIMKGLF